MLTDSVLDIDQFINTDLFAQTHSSPATASSSPSSPEQGLLTPPQSVPPPAFHDTGDGLGSSFSLFDDELKIIDSLNASPYDFLSGSSSSLDHSMSGYPPLDLGFGSLSGMAGLHMNTGVDMDLNMPILPTHSDALQQMSIDPQLMDTPASAAPISDFGDEDEDHEGDDEQSSQNTSVGASPASSASSPTEKEGERERLTLTIAPVKVGGHGKARRGTVQSGGVVKKTAMNSLLRDKENAISSAVFSSGARSAALATVATSASPTALPSPDPTSPTISTTGKSLPKPPTILKASSKKGKSKEGDEDDDDDVPQDWRPSPEVFAKMTSKEKRQLRNKISARNFRVRRKEYITTLEGDIAERDRLLEAIRSELGSTQSENLALRQEITALKKILLEGRGSADLPLLNLPPPAPLPVGLPAAVASSATNPLTSLSETMVPSPPTTPTPHQQANATVATNSATNPFAPNTQKDLPSSPTPRPFWGGQHQSLLGGMGGITPVHTALVPEVNVGSWGFNAKKVLGDSTGTNINPLLNAIGAGVAGAAMRKKEDEKLKLTGFDAFADANLFTMKSLDAYRMHLWGKMAAQHQPQQHMLPQQQASQHQLTGPAASFRPAHFVAPSLSPKATLASLISGKPSTSTNPFGLLTPPDSPRLGAQSTKALPPSQPSSSSQSAQQREREAQAAVLAVVASQTLLKKLGGAFWDAFSGSSSSSSSSSAASNSARSWDADKVRKVLEGKAVVKIVDVEPTPAPPAPAAPVTLAASRCCEEVKCTVSEILEESMRSLTLGKGSGTSRRH